MAEPGVGRARPKGASPTGQGLVDALEGQVREAWPGSLPDPVRADLLALHARVADASVRRPGDGFGQTLSQLPASWLERDGTGDLTGIAGIGRRPTAHRLVDGAGGAFAWCAWDGLFLPELLDRTLAIETSCPVTGAPIGLRVAPTGIVERHPAGIVLVFMRMGPDDFVADLRASFCAHVHFCVDARAASTFAAAVPGRCTLDPDDGFELGRLRNRVVFGGSPTRFRRPGAVDSGAGLP